MGYTLNIGKDQNTDKIYLCLADSDNTDVFPLAEFRSEEHAKVFEQFMGTQGYAAVKLPSDDEIDDLLRDQ